MAAASFRLRPPRSPGELIRMFGLHDPVAGLAGLVARFDLARVPSRRFARLVLRDGVDPPRTREDPARALLALLRSDVFRRNALRLLLDAYPNWARLLFVHVPKCAGSDLADLLRLRHVEINGQFDNPDWYPPEVLAQCLHDLVVASPFIEALLVTGHVPLHQYCDQGLIRSRDSVFTVVREPAEIVLSMANYVLTRLRKDPDGSSPDTGHWLRLLGLHRLPGGLGDDPDAPGWQDLARRVLREPRIVTPNTLCRSLGRGDAASALALMQTSRIEVTDVLRYESWLRERWGIAHSPHGNRSEPFLRAEVLNAADAAHVQDLVREDAILYGRIRARLDAAGGSSVRGDTLA